MDGEVDGWTATWISERRPDLADVGEVEVWMVTGTNHNAVRA